MTKALAIDGGGIRGLIPTLVLAEIERRTGRGIASLFDVIAGTSTGGIIACALTMPTPMTADEVADIYVGFYEDEPFVELSDAPPGVRDVRETNICRIQVVSEPRTGKLLVFSVIDNLWKGTASQAVQNLNLMFGFDETESLL